MAEFTLYEVQQLSTRTPGKWLHVCYAYGDKGRERVEKIIDPKFQVRINELPVGYVIKPAPDTYPHALIAYLKKRIKALGGGD